MVEAFVESLQGATPGVPGEWFQFALEARSDGILVGDLALKVDADEPREAEVGFTLAPAQQGKGYGTEALTALLDYAFEAFGLHRVVAVTDALNAPAAALLERVGMRREGHFVENVFFKGAWGSELGFALLEREWPSRASRFSRSRMRAFCCSNSRSFSTPASFSCAELLELSELGVHVGGRARRGRRRRRRRRRSTAAGRLLLLLGRPSAGLAS